LQRPACCSGCPTEAAARRSPALPTAIPGSMFGAHASGRPLSLSPGAGAGRSLVLALALLLLASPCADAAGSAVGGPDDDDSGDPEASASLPSIPYHAFLKKFQSRIDHSPTALSHKEVFNLVQSQSPPHCAACLPVHPTGSLPRPRWLLTAAPLPFPRLLHAWCAAAGREHGQAGLKRRNEALPVRALSPTLAAPCRVRSRHPSSSPLFCLPRCIASRSYLRKKRNDICTCLLVFVASSSRRQR
jgi:hypothetical protein